MASDSGGFPGKDGPLGPRTPGRHAAPRTTVRRRLQLPVGRALALTAVPTALLMGTIAPKLAVAADARSASTSSASELTGSGPEGTACTKTSLQALENGTSSSSGTASTPTAPVATVPTKGSAKGSAKGSTKAPAKTKSSAKAAAPSQRAVAPTTTGSGGTTPGSPAPTASTPAGTQPTNPIVGVLNGIGGLLGLDQGQPPRTSAATSTPTATPTATASPAASRTVSAADRSVPAPATTPAATPTVHPAVHPTTPAAPPSTRVATPPAGSGSGTARHAAAPTPSASAAPGSAAAANKLCDISNLAAPLDTSVTNGVTEMPSVPWTLKSSDLELINTQFWGVVTVPTAAGDVRVLKFTAQAVNIGDLDMSTQQIGQELHVQGGPGTTSTLNGGTVTMYVTSLSGTLASAEGIPLGWLGIHLTLTPDTLPQWLYDLIGDVPIPLTLGLTDAVATQTGQFGGNLTIPGMHLYYTPQS
jgi:hypothetical protein